ncbi:MAG: 2-amino-4-hydroxy-6-hydroxymethyldihydropteridine diphosphokinase [Tepidiformaceae bacterium]
MTTAVIALGANLGERAANLRAAVELMEKEGLLLSAASSIWETAPVPADQPPFLNAVVVGETALAPGALLAALKGIEAALGRRPGRRWAPRPIDLDILFYGDGVVTQPGLEIPHPRIAERAFVLAPLAEVLSGPLPVLGKTALELLAATGSEGVARTALELPLAGVMGAGRRRGLGGGGRPGGA